MSDEPVGDNETTEETVQIDPARLQYVLDRVRSQQNMAGAILAGLAASLLGAAVWAGVTVVTGYQIGWMAVGVGFLVGFTVRTVGKGVDTAFGFVGAGLALLGCGVGNLLAICGVIAAQENMAFMDVLSRLDLGVIRELMVATFNTMDLVFYGIAVYEGYKLSFRQVDQAELVALMPD